MPDSVQSGTAPVEVPFAPVIYLKLFSSAALLELIAPSINTLTPSSTFWSTASICFNEAAKIPIFNPEILEVHPPDYILILAWNFADMIIEKTKHLGIPYIIPFPEVKYINPWKTKKYL